MIIDPKQMLIVNYAVATAAGLDEREETVISCRYVPTGGVVGVELVSDPSVPAPRVAYDVDVKDLRRIVLPLGQVTRVRPHVA